MKSIIELDFGLSTRLAPGARVKTSRASQAPEQLNSFKDFLAVFPFRRMSYLIQFGSAQFLPACNPSMENGAEI
jgi:hypothetical protein